MFNEIMQLFREFEKYDSTNSFQNKYKDQLPPTSKDLETYIKVKESFNKQQRFVDFLNQHRNLVDAIAQSVIDNSSDIIKANVENSLNDNTRQTINKTVTWYFN